MQCVSICPVSAISDKLEWDLEKCMFCGACDNICPGHAVKVRTELGDVTVDGRTKEVKQ
jgi:Fe-S-cluster-containing hydrogenase component 2